MVSKSTKYPSAINVCCQLFHSYNIQISYSSVEVVTRFEEPMITGFRANHSTPQQYDGIICNVSHCSLLPYQQFVIPA